MTFHLRKKVLSLFTMEQDKEPLITAPPSSDSSGIAKKISSAVFYALCSFLITVVNKTVLTTYSFPSVQVLGLGQIVTTLIMLYVAKKLKFLTFPDLVRDTGRKIWPLPLVYMGNMIFGLAATKQLSLPMFTALRRFSILMTMVAELYVLGVKPSAAVQFSVYLMIIGALVAASDDLAFSLKGYVLVLLNDFFTATNNVCVKKKLDVKDLGKFGLMFYNSLFVLVPSVLVAWYTGELHLAYEFGGWLDALFLVNFLLSCGMGFLLQLSVFLCTQYNSALTTTVIGCLKNVGVTYLGMLIGGDYVYSVLNFVGLNIGVIASLVYAWVTFRPAASRSSKVQALSDTGSPVRHV